MEQKIEFIRVAIRELHNHRALQKVFNLTVPYGFFSRSQFKRAASLKIVARGKTFRAPTSFRWPILARDAFLLVI